MLRRYWLNSIASRLTQILPIAAHRRRSRRRIAIGSSQQVAALHGELLEARILLAGVLGFNATLGASVIEPGTVTTLTFDITNEDPSESVSDVAFTLTLPAGMTFAPVANGQSTIGGILTAPDGGDTLTFSGGGLAASSSGTVSVDVTSNLVGVYTITTGDLTSTGGNSGPASVDLNVITAPTLSMSFADPVAPGSTTSLQFTLTLGENAPAQATDVAFTVDLNSALAGLTAVGLPQADIAGAGSLLTGTSVITLTGGTLLPGEIYTFTVLVQVPQGASPGSVNVVSSDVSATMQATAVTQSGTSDNLDIAALVVQAAFIDGPAVAGGSITLEFTITNHSATDDATGIAFTADLADTLVGLTATGLPQSDICGTGSSFSIAGSILSLTGGNLLAGQSSTFSVVLDVPPGTSPESYHLVTSSISATIGGNPVILAPATASFEVSQPLGLAIEFPDGPAVAGGTTTLRFTLTNSHPTETLTNITFTSDLDAALAGLVAIGLPINDVVGAGSQVSGTSVLTLLGGSLLPLTSIFFDVTVQIPADATSGQYTVTTSAATGDVDAVSVTTGPANADLIIGTAVSIDNVTLAEGQSGTTDFIFTVTRSDNSSAFSVDYQTASDTADAGQDFVGIPRTTLQFEIGGSLTQTITVQVNGDLTDEPDETFFVNLTDAIGATLIKSQGVGTISNDDSPPVLADLETDPLLYAPHAAATVITSTLSLADSDSTDMTGATVQITGGYQAGDVLGFTNTPNITGVFNAGNGTLTLTGTDTTANYQAALRSVTYVSSSPNAAARAVSFQVSDGSFQSNIVTRTVGGFAQLNGGTVNVYGTQQGDVINVTDSGPLQFVVNGVASQFESLQVTAINIFGFGGNDTIQVDSLTSGKIVQAFGGGGNDTLRVDSSVTSGVLLNGGDGNDLLVGGSGNDVLIGGLGNDWLNGGDGSDSLTGGSGDDVHAFSGATGNQTDTVVELVGDGIDTLNFAALSTGVTVNLTSDTALATMAQRIVNVGTAGQSAHFENVFGGSADDFITGNASNNDLYGNGGNDTLIGADGNDYLDGGEGNDLLKGGNDGDVLIGGLGNDFLMGEAGNDELNGGDEFDALAGGLGDDTYVFNPATINQIDTVFELVGAGIDTLNFTALTTAVTVNLTSDSALATMAQRIVNVGSPGQSANVENAIGGSGNDQITGNEANNLLVGNASNDTIVGNGGSDILLGGDGNDTLQGISGRNLLIGGTGADLLQGGTGGDLLLSGSSSFESDPAILRALLTEWASLTAYQSRVDHLLGNTGGGANTTFTFNPATVTTDADADYLTGNAGQDWFLANSLQDVLTDKAVDEVFTHIDAWI